MKYRLLTLILVVAVLWLGLPVIGEGISDGWKTWGDYQYEIPDGMQVVYLCNYTGQDTVVTVPATIEGLPVVKLIGVFTYNTTIEEVTIPDGVKMLSYSFHDCPSLQKVHLPKGLLAIGFNTFSDCYALEELVIPESMQVIHYLALRNCPNLTVQGKAGSVAETACAKAGVNFEPLPPPSYSRGDVDKDGAITVTDARLTLQAAVNKITFGETEQQTAADVDDSGEVDVTDARMILGYSVGKDTFSSDLPSSSRYRLIPALPSNLEIIGQARESFSPPATITRPAGPIADPATFAKIVNQVTSKPPIRYLESKSIPKYQFTWNMYGEQYQIRYYPEGIAVYRMNEQFLFEWTKEQREALIACMDG